MRISKKQVVDTLRTLIFSSTTTEQLDCCLLFVNDTLYLRFGADKEVAELKELIAAKQQAFDLANANPLRSNNNFSII